MLHVGLDLSRRRLDVCLISELGELVDEIAAPPDADGLRYLTDKVGRRREPVRAVIESMTGARFVHDTLEQLGWDVRIADAHSDIRPRTRPDDPLSPTRSRRPPRGRTFPLPRIRAPAPANARDRFDDSRRGVAASRAVEHPDAARRAPGYALARSTVALIAADRGLLASARGHAEKARAIVGRITSSRSWLGANVAVAIRAVLAGEGDLSGAKRESGARASRGG